LNPKGGTITALALQFFYDLESYFTPEALQVFRRCSIRMHVIVKLFKSIIATISTRVSKHASQLVQLGEAAEIVRRLDKRRHKGLMENINAQMGYVLARQTTEVVRARSSNRVSTLSWSRDSDDYFGSLANSSRGDGEDVENRDWSDQIAVVVGYSEMREAANNLGRMLPHGIGWTADGSDEHTGWGISQTTAGCSNLGHQQGHNTQIPNTSYIDLANTYPRACTEPVQHTSSRKCLF